MDNVLQSYLSSIEGLLDSINNELKKQNSNDVIKKGDKVIYDNNVYYYGGFEDGVHILCDRFMRANIGINSDKQDGIIKVTWGDDE